MSKTIQDRIEQALKDEWFTDERVRWLDDSMREYMESCGKKATASLLLVGVFFLAWILVRSAAIGEISVLGVKVDNAKVVTVLLPLFAAFSLYQYHCWQAVASLLTVARVRLFRARYKSLYDNDFEQLLTHSDVFEADNALTNLAPQGSWMRRVSEPWHLVAGLAIFVVPCCAVAIMVYFTVAEPPVAWPWCIASAVVSLLLLIRSVMVLVVHMKQI